MIKKNIKSKGVFDKVLKAENEALEKERNTLKEQLEKMNEGYGLLINKNNISDKYIKELLDLRQKDNEKYNELKKENNELNQYFEVNNHDIGKLENKLEVLKEKYDELKKENENKEDIYNRMSSAYSFMLNKHNNDFYLQKKEKLIKKIRKLNRNLKKKKVYMSVIYLLSDKSYNENEEIKIVGTLRANNWDELFNKKQKFFDDFDFKDMNKCILTNENFVIKMTI